MLLCRHINYCKRYYINFRKHNSICRTCVSIREFTVIQWTHYSTKWKHQQTTYNCIRKHISWFHHINGGYYRWNNNINKLSRGHWNNGKTYYPASYGLLSRLRHNSLGSIRAMWRKCWTC